MVKVFLVTDTSHSERLRQERKRLSLTQAQAAQKAAVTRETWSRYETGALLPGMEVLAALANAGADVHYILTGQRQGVPSSAPAQEQETPLAPDERILLDNYRHSPPDAQAALKATSDAFARRTGKKAG
ncbi:TPA: helix-turn-helix domain-containing protein [Pseudomonas aeruginosa]|uniref:helix-turn-helix domain-containing protein n=2 Tax=Pseudomonas aeruginosa TaxID=287 RepID=UPI000F53B254|nr:helix-turn-helix domain-containing protein [Pseudomonas aeruginosa]MBI8444804.1 helix-turn-helix domain-containing protein [Pseudomonas aeruginosa]MBX5544138.1 helix-turn-helix domain-containing protein [Pseudomonas aeruginosa]MCV3833287.1 helix-turn-helix domain-containing protein [Pseudomonas aeruginosa]MCV3901292.1 helix-turn-helix domain-containing protein [Pseudomonas aeruginosa]MCV3925867.1 helix-turn-helix domain-containing protein [Pseudomonas aeruginosa]